MHTSEAKCYVYNDGFVWLLGKLVSNHVSWSIARQKTVSAVPGYASCAKQKLIGSVPIPTHSYRACPSAGEMASSFKIDSIHYPDCHKVALLHWELSIVVALTVPDALTHKPDSLAQLLADVNQANNLVPQEAQHFHPLLDRVCHSPAPLVGQVGLVGQITQVFLERSLYDFANNSRVEFPGGFEAVRVLGRQSRLDWACVDSTRRGSTRLLRYWLDIVIEFVFAFTRVVAMSDVEVSDILLPASLKAQTEGDMFEFLCSSQRGDHLQNAPAGFELWHHAVARPRVHISPNLVDQHCESNECERIVELSSHRHFNSVHVLFVSTQNSSSFNHNNNVNSEFVWIREPLRDRWANTSLETQGLALITGTSPTARALVG